MNAATYKRTLWIDTQGEPVITTTPNGERNAARWGWAKAVPIKPIDPDELARVIADTGIEWQGNYDTVLSRDEYIATAVKAWLKGEEA